MNRSAAEELKFLISTDSDGSVWLTVEVKQSTRYEIRVFLNHDEDRYDWIITRDRRTIAKAPTTAFDVPQALQSALNRYWGTDLVEQKPFDP
ncbi:hypothetical protein [Xanthomonas campestris]|uniref:hypothetical protein n=1 Tax=Xanthomonas campestris TaxID=339 RepID=UPI001CD59AB0|nr:hypothetical protein [Xanthomonas campestris]